MVNGGTEPEVDVIVGECRETLDGRLARIILLLLAERCSLDGLHKLKVEINCRGDDVSMFLTRQVEMVSLRR